MNSTTKSRFIGILAIVLMLGLNSYDASARGQRHRNPTPPQDQHHGNKGGNKGGNHGGNNVGAPLDGGILTLLLGGAGAAYFAIKKRRNQK